MVSPVFTAFSCRWRSEMKIILVLLSLLVLSGCAEAMIPIACGVTLSECGSPQF